MNDGGVALVVWSQSDGTYNHVWSNHYTREAGWGTAGPIEGYVGTRLWGPPQVAIDAAGNGLAVWVLDDGDGTERDAWASRYTQGSGWGTAERIESDRAGAPEELRIAMDASGQALATWWVSGDATGLWAKRFEPATGWQTAERIEAEGHSVKPAVNGRGDAMIVYMITVGDPITLGTTLFGKRYVAGTGWAEASVIETTVVEGVEDYGSIAAPTLSSPQLTLAADGTALAVWLALGHPRFGVEWARAPAGGGWESLAPSDLSELGEGAVEPRLFGNPTGDAVAAWTPQPVFSTVDGVLSRRYHPSTGWTEIENIQGNASESPQTPHLAGNASGDFVAVWSCSDATHSSLWFSRGGQSTGWGTALSIATGSVRDAAAQAAVDGSGNALVVWRRADGDRLDLLAQAFPAE